MDAKEMLSTISTTNFTECCNNYNFLLKIKINETILLASSQETSAFCASGHETEGFTEVFF